MTSQTPGPASSVDLSPGQSPGPVTGADVAGTQSESSPDKLAVRRFLKNPIAVIGVIALVIASV